MTHLEVGEDALQVLVGCLGRASREARRRRARAPCSHRRRSPLGVGLLRPEVVECLLERHPPGPPVATPTSARAGAGAPGRRGTRQPRQQRAMREPRGRDLLRTRAGTASGAVCCRRRSSQGRAGSWLRGAARRPVVDRDAVYEEDEQAQAEREGSESRPGAPLTAGSDSLAPRRPCEERGCTPTAMPRRPS